MVAFSRRGKPLCSWCRRLATHAIHYSSGGRVAYAYQCALHKHASSEAIGTTHMREQFVIWLTARRSSFVGRSAEECHCPLAHFYSSYFKVSCRVTLSGDVESLCTGRLLSGLPDWAKAFVLAVDFTHPFDRITGQQALKLLEGV